MTPLPLPIVLITNRVPPEALAPLTGIAEVVQGPANGDLMSRAEVLRRGPTLSGIINQAELRVDRELLDCAPSLRIVANVAIGVDNLDLGLMQSRGIYGTNVPHAFVAATADLTLGMILALARRMLEADRYVRAGLWSRFQPGIWDGALLAGKTLGLVGYGAIAQAVAQRARAFGLRVMHHRRSTTPTPDCVPLDQLLQEADFVSLHLPLTTESTRLLDATRLQRMKKGAFLINASRGRIVDEAALVDALQSGHLAGAGLDVFENEPQVHPALVAMPNVILTPHIGGGTRESRHEARFFCARNVALVLTGRPPLTPKNAPRPVTGEAPRA